jgi:isoleucyl-tRNA synthetase
MDFKFEADTIRALKILIEKDYLKQGFKPVYWCFACQSSLAEAEVEYADKKSPSIDVKFKVKDEATFLKAFSTKDLGHGDISIVIWTTTPWTLPANYGVALHPELDYALVQINNERIVLARDLVEKNMERYEITDYKILGATKGETLEGLKLQHPFYDRESVIVLGEHVTTDAGTGAVHTAPAHGEDDFRIGKRYDLSHDSPVMGNGLFAEGTEFFAGENIFKANEHVIEVLKEKNALIKSIEITHSYPHCWRHKTPVIYRATPQWFLSAKDLCKIALKELPNIHWKPEWGQERMLKMLEDRPDWCISRQRTWGAPIPLFINKKTQKPHLRSAELMEEVAKLVEKSGIQAWFDLSTETLLGKEAADYDKVTDVLDVWFESGITHYAVLEQRPELHFPAQVYLEGSDQYRGWFQSSLLTSVGIHDKAPYETLITHGFTVDEHGRKMSKSIGNVIAPENIIKTYGADVLRLWIASTDYSTEITLSEEILKRTSETYRRIRNTARFLLSNLYDFEFERDKVRNGDLLKIDQWIVAIASETEFNIIQQYKEFNFHNVIQKIHHFCSIHLGSFYLDVLKDRMYTCKEDGVPRRSGQTAMYHIIEALVRWIAPILSFTADEIWKNIPNRQSESVHLREWYSEEQKHSSEQYSSFLFSDSLRLSREDGDLWDRLIFVRQKVNVELEKARNEGRIGSGLEAEVTLCMHKNIFKQLSQLGKELKFIFIVSKVNLEKLENDNEEPIIEVKKYDHPKCDRCWHRCPEVTETKTICDRCELNLNGEGEPRKFA